jgi:hypothetical protein
MTKITWWLAWDEHFLFASFLMAAFVQLLTFAVAACKNSDKGTDISGEI